MIELIVVSVLNAAGIVGIVYLVKTDMKAEAKKLLGEIRTEAAKVVHTEAPKVAEDLTGIVTWLESLPKKSEVAIRREADLLAAGMKKKV